MRINTPPDVTDPGEYFIALTWLAGNRYRLFLKIYHLSIPTLFLQLLLQQLQLLKVF